LSHTTTQLNTQSVAGLDLLRPTQTHTPAVAAVIGGLTSDGHLVQN
jgi:hypothetical protein